MWDTMFAAWALGYLLLTDPEIGRAAFASPLWAAFVKIAEKSSNNLFVPITNKSDFANLYPQQTMASSRKKYHVMNSKIKFL